MKLLRLKQVNLVKFGSLSLVWNLTIKKGLTNHAQIGLELELLFL